MREVVELPQIPYSVCLIHDVEYKRVKAMPKGSGNDLLHRGLQLQFLIPRAEDLVKRNECYPAVIYSPGGGWKTPLVHYRLPGIVDLVKRGFVVVMVEYRGREYYNTWSEAACDVRSAVRYAVKNAKEYSIDPDNIFLLGDSAGAHLSMMASIGGSEFDDPEDDLRIPVCVRGVMELFGPTDLVRLCREVFDELDPQIPIVPVMQETFFGFARTSSKKELQDLLAPAGVLSRIRREAAIPPMLLAQGDQDIMVPQWCAEELYEALYAAGKEAELYILKGARHGDMRFYEKDMLDRYERFIRRHIVS